LITVVSGLIEFDVGINSNKQKVKPPVKTTPKM
jgi:hypothetical protein